MRTVKQVRIQLGLNQGNMARFLGISRTSLAQAENGHASLSIKALKNLAIMERALNKVEVAPGCEELAGDELIEYIRGYQLREQNCLYQANLLKRKIRELDELHEHNTCLLKVLNELRTEGEFEPGWLNEMKAQAMLKLATCTVPIREKMRTQVSLLINEAEHIRQYLGNRSVL